jgi:hypothetical protein
MTKFRLLLTVLIGLAAAVVGFLTLEIGKHLWNDHRALHEVIGVINYNLQSGALHLPAGPTSAATPPPAAPAPTPPK